MPSFVWKNFKGLRQDIEFEELSPEYSHSVSNVDFDNPAGQISLRGGFSKKYADAFTDMISAYEYKFPTSGQTILIVNDNGALKYLTNGASLAAITLTGVTA